MQLITVNSTVRSETGSIKPFKSWAESQGITLADKAARKAAMVQYDAEKKLALDDNRRLMGAVATDSRFDVRKFQIVRSKKTDEVIGYNIAGRTPAKEKAVKATKPEIDPAVVEAKAREIALAAIVKSTGLTPENAAKLLDGATE